MPSSHALASALLPQYPALVDLNLVDYKVRVVNSADGTAAKVRVFIEHHIHGRSFGTVGVNENIIEASWLALVEGVSTRSWRSRPPRPRRQWHRRHPRHAGGEVAPPPRRSAPAGLGSAPPLALNDQARSDHVPR